MAVREVVLEHPSRVPSPEQLLTPSTVMLYVKYFSSIVGQAAAEAEEVNVPATEMIIKLGRRRRIVVIIGIFISTLRRLLQICMGKFIIIIIVVVVTVIVVQNTHQIQQMRCSLSLSLSLSLSIYLSRYTQTGTRIHTHTQTRWGAHTYTHIEGDADKYTVIELFAKVILVLSSHL